MKEVCRVAKVKQIKKVVKLQIQAGKANPAPPVGPALGQAGVNIQQFCSQFNDKTAGMIGYVIPVEIFVYEDRTFTFITKTPPAADLLKKAAGIQKGSANSVKTKVATLKREKLLELARIVDTLNKEVEIEKQLVIERNTLKTFTSLLTITKPNFTYTTKNIPDIIPVCLRIYSNLHMVLRIININTPSVRAS